MAVSSQIGIDETAEKQIGNDRDSLINQIQQYQPWNEQEQRDKEVILERLHKDPDIFYRTSPLAHMSASAWVVNQERTKVLLVYHNIYRSWSWLGGHSDGEKDLLSTAMKEVREESGAEHIRAVSKDIFSLEVLTVDGHEKKGEYVPSHLHLNVTYLLEADEADSLRVKEDENSAVAWFGLEEAVAASAEPWFQQRIYRKLNQKLRACCSR